MKIINKVDNANCRQWVEELTKQAIQSSKLDCTEVVIDEFDYGERIFLKINEADYTIRIWDFHPLNYGKKVHDCKAIVSYTLFMMVEDEDGNRHGEQIDYNILKIEWKK